MLVDSTELPEVSWAGMVEWLTGSLVDQPVALIVEIGPNSYVGEDDDEEVDRKSTRLNSSHSS